MGGHAWAIASEAGRQQATSASVQHAKAHQPRRLLTSQICPRRSRPLKAHISGTPSSFAVIKTDLKSARRAASKAAESGRKTPAWKISEVSGYLSATEDPVTFILDGDCREINVP